MQLHWSSPNLHNNHRGEEVLIYLASLIAQLIKNPPAMWETLVRFLVFNLFSHKISCISKVSPEREKQMPDIDTYVESKRKWYKGSFVQSRNGDTDK